MVAQASQTIRDRLDPARAGAFQAMLGRDITLGAGDALPPFLHHLYFWDPQPPGALGRDGHPRVGGLIPDLGLPRRMWAGGRLAFHRPLRLGQAAEKTSTLESAERKTGRTGPLGFVTLRHELSQNGTLCLTEWQSLVYREDPDPTAPAPALRAAPTDESSARVQAFDETLLFRYSALTFNGHRIHYDADYARRVEGYPGLVVHGPLLAQLMMLMAEEELGPLSGFSYRAVSPLTLPDAATICRRDEALWVRGLAGQLCMEGRVLSLE